MIKGNDIGELVALFERREVVLYHACQYVDFISYLNVGGIPSRAYLENAAYDFTTFETDSSDKSVGVWDKVFFNITDSGKTFANGGNGVPNSYGPILFQLKPTAFLNTTDVAICLRSAGKSGFNRESESLMTIEEVDRLFLHPRDCGYPKSAYVKYSKDLKEEFEVAEAHDPEISCTVKSGIIEMSFVNELLIDPYVFSGKPLCEYVSEATSQKDLKIPVNQRYASLGAKMYNDLAALISDATPTLAQLQCFDISGGMKEWAKELARRGLDYQFRRYAEYLRNGTIIPLRP